MEFGEGVSMKLHDKEREVLKTFRGRKNVEGPSAPE